MPRNALGCFSGRLLIWHFIAVLLTFLLVTSGLDWRYFLATRSSVLHYWLFPAVHIGGLVPLVLPLGLLALGGLAQSAWTRQVGWAIGQAELLGSLLSSGYKALTGRAHPAHTVGADLSHTFRFGLLRGGVFWGWPSSHTTIAFAMAVTVFKLFPQQRWLGSLTLAYAFYVGLGVSISIHWLSDFIAGAILGSIIGVVVGKTFSSADTGQTRSASTIAPQTPLGH